jgi:hypothetical protein
VPTGDVGEGLSSRRARYERGSFPRLPEGAAVSTGQAAGRRAISGPLTRVTSGLSRSLADTPASQVRPCDRPGRHSFPS